MSLRSSRLLKLTAAAVFTGAVASCDDPTRPTIEASIEPRIELIRADSATRASLVLPLTEVRVRTFGPTGRVVPLTLQGGVWRGTITGLTAGDYEVVIEGLANGQVQYYGRLPNISIARGQRAQPTVQFAAAVPVVTNPPLQNTTNFSQRVPFAGIPAATGYVVQVSQDNNFVNGVTEFTAADTNPLVNVTQPGTWYIRSRAVLPQVPASSIPWSEVRSWVVVEADGGDDAANGRAVPLAPETPQTVGDRNITPTKREDWYDIALQQGDSLFAETFAARLVFPSALNTTLTLFRNNGSSEVAQNLDATGTTDSRLVHVAAHSETYKLRVGATGNTSGHYELISEIRRLPLAPSGLLATVVSGTEVALAWGDNSNNETSFRIERCAGVDCTDFAEVGTSAANAAVSSQSGLVQGTTYRWRVRARNNVGNSGYTNTAVTALVGPAAPTGLAASTLSNRSVRLTWTDASTNETGFEIQRCTVGNECTFAALTTTAADVAQYVDTSVVYNTSYQYQVRATNSVVPSAFTAAVAANTVPPTTPTGLIAQVAGPTTINLSWTDASDNETFFLIERCLGDGCTGFSQVDSVLAGVTAYASTVVNNSAYRFRIRARNVVISETFSNIAESDTRPPAAPTGLVATTQSATAIALQWTDVADDETGYRIERCSSGAACADFTAVATTAAGIVVFTDSSAAVNISYRYRVTAVGIPGNSAPSNIAEANTLLPAAPSGLAASVITASVIRLSWTDNADNETGYSLARCTGAACSTFTVLRTFPSGVTTVDDSTAVAGEQYTYVLRATNISGPSPASNTSGASTLPPSAPTGFAATLVSASRIDLTWTNTDASSIGTRVERCTGVGCDAAAFTEITLAAGSVATYSDLSTTAGNFYRYRLRAQNAADVSAFTAIVDVDARLMAAPSGVNAAVSSAAPQITVGWTAATGPGLTGYEVRRCDAADCTNFAPAGGVGAAQNSYTEDVPVNREYRYIVRAVNLVGPGPFSDTVYVNTQQPNTPTGVAAELRPRAVRITWTDNSNNETGSVVERCEGGGCIVFTAVGLPVGANVTTFDDTTAVAGTTYNYRVYASNLLGSTPGSTAVSITPFLPGAPSTLGASTVSGTQINLTWTDNSLNEIGFEIRRCTGVSCSTFAAIDSVGANIGAFSDITVTAGESYTYAVAAYAAFGSSNPSAEVTATTFLPDAPTVLAAQTLSNSSVRLTWTDNSNNETGFAVQRCAGVDCAVPAGSFVTLPAGTIEYTDSGLASNETFRYHVFASNTVGNSAPTNVATATTNVPAIPGSVAGNITAPNSLRISWTDLATNETGYKVERCNGDPCVYDEIYLGVAAGETEFIDTGVNDGTTYQYRVRAYGVAGNSDYAPAVVITAGEPLAPTAPAALATAPTAIRVTWTDASNNEDGFTVQRCSDLTCAVIDASGNVGRNVTEYTDATVTVGNEYFFRVFASNGAGSSATSATVTVNTLLPDAPTALTATTFSATQVDLAWTDNGPNETGFEIQRCSGGGCSTFAVVDTAAANAVSFSDAGLTSGLSFSYQVRAVNGVGQSAFTNVATAATNLPAAPTNVTAVIDNPTDVTLNWTDNANNEDEFFIERCEGSNCNTFGFLAVVGADVTSYQDQGLTTGNTYRYRVRASNSAGVSPFAPTAVAALVIPALPTGFSATVASGTLVNLAWTDAANNELNYQIERCAESGCSNFALRTTRPANSVSYVDTVGTDSIYTYQIRAVNNVGPSAYVASAEVNTIRPDLPTGFAVTTFSATQVDLTWTDVATNETGYLVERCAGVGCSTFDTLIVLGVDVAAHQDQNLTADESYTYRLTAFNVAGNRGVVGPLSATTLVPAQPTDFAGVAQSATQINLSWTDVATNELGYRIERCNTAGCNNFVEVTTVGEGQTTFANTELVANTVYRYRLSAFNAAGPSPFATLIQVVTSAPSAPSNVTATVLTVSEVRINFTDASTNETGFTIQRCLTANCDTFGDLTTLPAASGGLQTYVDNTLSAGQVARYRVRAVNNVGITTSAVAQASTIVPNVPSAASAFPQGQTQMFVQWADNATDEGGYIVERCTGETCTDFAPIDTTTGDPASILDMTVLGGNFYRYRVRAFGNGTTSFGASAYSNEALASTIIPANPTGLTADPVSDNRVDLSWTNNANNADNFRVFRCSVAACVPLDQLGTTGSGTVTTYSDLTAVANQLYRYSVSATNGAGESAVSNVAEAGTDVPGLPSGLAATIISATQVQLTWTDNATTETGFEIQRCEGLTCTNFANLTTTAANVISFNDATVADSTFYRYRIRATTGTVFSGYTTPVLASTSPPTIPASVIITPNATDLVVSWTDAATDEASYEVERCTGSTCTDFVPVATLPANSISFSEAWTADTVYRYQVRALNAAGASAYSSIATRSTYRPLVPASFTATTATATSIDLAWTAGSANASGYRLYRCQGENCIVAEVLTFDSTVTAHLDQPLGTGLDFTYDLRAFNIFGNGPLVGEVTASTNFPAVPGSFVASTVSATEIALQWDDLSGNETGFEVYRCESVGCTPSALVTTTAAGVESYSDVVGVVIGGVYRYHIRAINGAGASPVTTVAETNTQLPVNPGSVGALALSPASARLQWDSQANTARYRIERCDTPGCNNYTPLDSVAHPLTEFVDNTVASGDTYGYRVRGVNAVGTSAEGTGVVVAMVAPATVSSLSAVALSGTQVQVTWVDNSNNELGFAVNRCTGGGCVDFLPVDTLAAGTTSLVDATVSQDERYVYEVVAFNNVGNGTAPTVQMQTTAPDAPAQLVATTTAPGTIDLTWDLPATNELSVEVERCSGATCTNFSRLVLLGAGATEYRNTGVATGVEWRYQVRAINNVGPSNYSNVGQANTIVPPAVTGLATTLVNGQRIDLAWVDGPIEQEYVVERCAGACGSGFSEIATLPANTTSYVNNTGVAYGVAYTYRVTGRNVAGLGTPSNLVATSTALNNPTSISARVLNRNQVQLDWVHSPNMQQYVYQLLRCAGPDCDASTGTVIEENISAGTLQFVDNLPQGADVSYAVRARTAGGVSNPALSRAARTPINLADRVAVTGLADPQLGERHFVFSVPADALALRLRMDVSSGDPDMYVKFGETPTTDVNLNDALNCVAYDGRNPEICTFDAPPAGDWYTMLQAWSTYGGTTLKSSLAERFGWPVSAGAPIDAAGSFNTLLISHSFTITEPTSLTHLGLNLAAVPVGTSVRVGLYSSRVATVAYPGETEEPNQLLTQIDLTSPVVGVNELQVSEIVLAPGKYWLASVANTSATYGSSGQPGVYRFFGVGVQTYAGGFPAVWPAGDSQTDFPRHNLFIRGFR